MSIYNVPDGNNLAHIQCIVIQLGYKDGRHCLIECCAIHVDSGAHWEDEAGDPLVYAVVLLSTSEGDGQGSRAGKNISWIYHSDLVNDISILKTKRWLVLE